MKHNRTSPAGATLIPVRFEFTHPTATEVCIAGSFNQWQPEAKKLQPGGGGRWFKETAIAPGTYEYCLIVDGEWLTDPLSNDYIPNLFGGRNSILNVACPSALARSVSV